MNVSQAIAKVMKAYGADYVFTLTGAPQDPLIEMQNHEEIRVVLGRSERSALFMADAYARLTGKPTFGIVQFGPGATYLPASIIDAFWANSPLIAISGSISTNTKYRYEYQEIDQTGMFPSMTKWCGDLPAPDRIVDVMRTVIRAAVSGVPGPCYLGIPSDAFAKQLSKESAIYAEPGFTRAPAMRIAPLAADIERAVAALARAERPMILAGGGVMLSEAWGELTSVAEELAIPVVTSMAGKGSIADTHPLAVGVSGRYSRKVANEALADCDTCLVVGSRLGSMVTDVSKFPKPGTRIIHIDLDPMTLGRTYKEDVSIVADAQVALGMLGEAAKQAKLHKKPARWGDWTKKIQADVKAWRANFQKLAKEQVVDGRLNPRYVLACLNDTIRGDDVIVADTGYMAAWTATMVDQKAAGRGSLRAAGSLGWAFPAGLGAKLAVGSKRRVFCLTGDGGIGYHIADLETALRLKLPVTTIVMNNASLAFEYHVQKFIHKEMCPEASEFLDTNYAEVAKAFGAYGERVSSPDALKPALRKAEESGRPALIDVVISREVAPPVSRYEAVTKREL